MDEEPILPNSDGQILRFPVKLRKIIDTCQTDAIGWNQEGTVVRINKTVFETEYLSKAHRPFQTTSFSSFIRQLNFYGFQKVNQRASLKVSDDSDPVFFDYRHPHFKRNSADLSLVQRKNKSRRPQNFEDAFARIIEPSSKVSLSHFIKYYKKIFIIYLEFNTSFIIYLEYNKSFIIYLEFNNSFIIYLEFNNSLL